MNSIYDTALVVQDGRNVRGISQALAKVTLEAGRELREAGLPDDEEAIRSHPAVILIINKLEDMVGSNLGQRYDDARWSCLERYKNGQ